MTFISCKLFSKARTLPVCFQGVLLREDNQSPFWTLPGDVFFFALRVSFEQIYYAFAETPAKLCWTRLKEKNFSSAGNWLDHLGRGGILCVRRPKKIFVSAGPGLKKWGTGSTFCTLMYYIICTRQKNQINKWPYGINVASRYQSTSSYLSPTCALSDFFRIVGFWNKIFKMCRIPKQIFSTCHFFRWNFLVPEEKFNLKPEKKPFISFSA